MSLNQVTLDIPLNIQKGLDSGIYKRYGSIIRNSSGHIVKYLKEVKVGEPAQQVVKGLAKNKYVLITSIGATALAVGGVGDYAFISKRYKKFDSEIDELFDLVYDYTIQFCKVNGFETDTISEVGENNKVINLMDYLNFQKEILSKIG
jgi:hypothetical protein